MKLRPATNADRDDVETLIFTILRTYGLEPSPDSTDADLADIEGNYPRNAGIFDVVEARDGTVVGTVAVHRTSDSLCELRKMYLAEELRGHGWGKRLLDHAIEKAKTLGYKSMWLETADSLEVAHRLYKQNGFEAWEAPHQSARCDFAMKRDL